MTHRNSVTLIEVLVAIFVMGIGMLALLALFPLGILRMTQAIQDEKCSEACRMAVSVATLQNLRNDPLVWTLDTTTLTPSAGINTYASPQWLAGLAGPPTWQGKALLPADPDESSYPIFVDPMGFNQVSLTIQSWLTQSGNTIPRRSTSFVNGTGIANPANNANHWCTIQDDLVYGQNGAPLPVIGPVLTSSPQLPGTFNRDTRFAWAYMLQRPRTADPSFVNLTVCVFNGRALTGTFNEYLYQTVLLPPVLATDPPQLHEVDWDPVANTITLTSANLPPARPGNWLLDASYVPSATGPYATVNGNFYRIVSVTQTAVNSVTYEVQPSLRNFPATSSPNSWQKVVFLEGLAEVFEKGPGRVP